MKDWLVWLCCLLLFLVGVLFGGVWIPKSDFFKVDNVHDGLEILAALATLIAVFAAWRQLDSWRNQHSSTNDHNLAIKAASILSERAYHTKKVWLMAAVVHFALAAREAGKGDPDLKGLHQFAESSSDNFKQGAGLLKGVAFECEMLWGDGYITPLMDVILLGDLCSQYLDAFVAYSSDTPPSILGSGNIEFLRSLWGEIESRGIAENGEVIAYVDSRVGGFKSSLRSKLIRR